MTPPPNQRSAISGQRSDRDSAIPHSGFRNPHSDFSVSAFQLFSFSRVNARVRAFTMLELLVVIGLISLMTVLVAPAFTTRKPADDLTAAANTIKGALEQARTYAMANNTYTWVGFFEEDISSPTPATQGVGRVVMSVVASKDGTELFNTNDSGAQIDSTKLTQVGKLIKIDNVHLPIFKAYPSTNTGETFDTRPATTPAFGRFGDINSAGGSPSTDSKFPFQYPIGNPAPAAQYTFKKTLQFSPRGESRVNSTYDIRGQVEVGLQPTRGTTLLGNDVIDASGNPAGNLLALQLSGIGGNVKIYRK